MAVCDHRHCPAKPTKLTKLRPKTSKAKLTPNHKTGTDGAYARLALFPEFKHETGQSALIDNRARTPTPICFRMTTANSTT